MTGHDDADLGEVAIALGFPADASLEAVVERAGAMRLVREAATLDRVREDLAMPAGATTLACVAELCRRLPVEWHHVAVLAMQVIEVRERGRELQVDLIRRDAIDAAGGAALG